LREVGLQRLELWSRGIDLGGFSPDRRDQELRNLYTGGNGDPVLLIVSRLVKEKDLMDLVKVNRLLRERGVRFNFALVGEGPLRAKLERALPEAVFVGHLSGEAL